MKRWLIGTGMIFLFFTVYSQQKISFSDIDWKMQLTDAATPDSLAHIINKNFTTPLEKLRAVYSWITTHIEYNNQRYKPRHVSYNNSPDPLDTAAVWPSGDEMVARKVMRKRSAVCDGYARLFKVLCNYTGIEAVVVQGYARGINSNKFRTNHSWNAVRLDSNWHLLDVTWASGYLNGSDDFVPKQNDHYFLTLPEDFIRDHYPEELRWTLMTDPPMPAEFKKSPFRSKNFYKYEMELHSPHSGVIEARPGDTLYFSLQLKDVKKASQTGNDPFMDTATYSLWPSSAFIKPGAEKKKNLSYSYVVEPNAEWIHLLFNHDVVLHYRLVITNKNTSELAFK